MRGRMLRRGWFIVHKFPHHLVAWLYGLHPTAPCAKRCLRLRWAARKSLSSSTSKKKWTTTTWLLCTSTQRGRFVACGWYTHSSIILTENQAGLRSFILIDSSISFCRAHSVGPLVNCGLMLFLSFAFGSSILVVCICEFRVDECLVIVGLILGLVRFWVSLFVVVQELFW